MLGIFKLNQSASRMDRLSASSLNGKGVRINLNDGSSKIGYIPAEAADKNIENKVVYFLPWQKKEKFDKAVEGQKVTIQEEIKDLVEIIPRRKIKSFEVMEQSLSGIYLENNKPIPQWLQLKVLNVAKPGYLSIEYKIPQHEEWFEMGEVPIKNSQINLPLTLAFLSYAKEDKEKVKMVMNELHNYGVLTWFDEKDLIPGDNWKAKIEEAIETSDYVLVFLSSDTLNKTGYKNKEIKYALEQRDLRPSGERYVIPILLDNCTPPREFREIHWLKAWGEEWLNKLLMAVGKHPKHNKINKKNA